MKSHELLPTLERLFAGPREQRLTMNELLAGLEARSYAFIILALDLINIVPSGIPLLSTVTGLPMLLFVFQDYYLRQPAPTLPQFLGNRTLPRGRLQDMLERLRKKIIRMENAIHPRHDWWVSGVPRRALQVAWVLMIVILALPIPFDNFFPAAAIMFFCLALIEGDGIMAMLGWLMTLVTLAWTALLLIVGSSVAIGVIKSLI